MPQAWTILAAGAVAASTAAIFEDSSVADIHVWNDPYYVTYQGNTSVGRKSSFLHDAGGQDGAQFLFQDNKILDPQDDVAIEVVYLGNVILLDNQIGVARSGWARSCTWPQLDLRA